MQGFESTLIKTEHRGIHFGGCSSLFSQPVTPSVFSGSGPSQSKHWNVRGPLPPRGSARIKKAPQWGQVGRLAWPMQVFCDRQFIIVCTVPDTNTAEIFRVNLERFAA